MTRQVEHVDTDFGRIAYEERGSGPSALFVHGVFLNGYLWRHLTDQLSDRRRCIAIDLLAHGLTETPPGQDLSFTAQADMLAAFCEALGLGLIDLFAHGIGRGIGRIFAAGHPARLWALTLDHSALCAEFPPDCSCPDVQSCACGR